MISQIQELFSTHEQMLQLRAKRSEIIASNLVNADTPGYKAKDIDFKAYLDAQIGDAGTISTTNPLHITDDFLDEGMALLYRTPNQPSLDGNTVDTQIENAAFAENTIRYMATMRFLDGKIKSTIAAIRGE